jgi:hypothetical protein
MPPWENSPRLLEANVPGNAGYGDVDAGSMSGIPERNPVRVTPAPNVRGLLPDTASEPNWMRRNIKPFDIDEYLKTQTKPQQGAQ